MEIISGLSKLETEKTGKLLWEYSVPAIISSLVVAIYNFIDSIYIGHGPGLGDHAIGGLGIVLPIMTIQTALGLLVGTGAASRISINLGMGHKDAAERVLGNAFILIILLTGILVLTMYLFLSPMLHLIGATVDTYYYAREFLIFYLPCTVFFNLCFVLCSAMRASGYPKKAMYAMLLGVVANILLAPLFIFVFKWGMKGAAIATSIATIISLIPVLQHFASKNTPLRLLKDKISLDPKVIWTIFNIGFAPFIIQFTASIVAFFINNRIRVYGGSVDIEAYTIANRLTLIIILVISGLTQGMQPIVGYNFGAKKMKRVISTVKYAVGAGIAIGVVGLIAGYFFADILVKPFNPSVELAEQSRNVLQIIVLMLPLSGIQMVISNFFQSIGMAGKAAFISLTRQLLFLVPALFVLSYIYKLDGIWMSIPVSDFLSTVLALGIYFWQMHRFNKLKLLV